MNTWLEHLQLRLLKGGGKERGRRYERRERDMRERERYERKREI